MLEKSIKDNPIVVGACSQWIVSNSGRKEAIDSKVMGTNLKYKVDEISSSTTSTANIINKLKTSGASAKKAAKTTISKLRSLANK